MRFSRILVEIFSIYFALLPSMSYSSSQLSISSERTTYTISTTTKLFNITICTCLLEDLNDVESLFCPNGYKFNIINAYMFDSNELIDTNGGGSSISGESSTTCKSKPDNRLPIRSDLFNYLQNNCNDTICELSGALLLGFLDPSVNWSCISADIIWNCYKPIASYSIQNQLNQAYSFTYFFYVITLVLSSSCILIGGLFVIRRFLKLRRRSPSHNNQHRSRSNQGYVPSNGTLTTNDIWTTGSYPPPTYEHIDESSLPINPPPSYNAALLLNYQSKEKSLKNNNMVITGSTNNFENLNNKTESSEGVVLYRPNNQTEQPSNEADNRNQVNDGEILIMFNQPNDSSVSNKSDEKTPQI